jgi:acetylornithine/N-succinyldiaminopimelate aminotransferase
MAGTSHELQKRYTDSMMNTFGPPKLVLARGEGCYVWDADGTRYLDMLGGIAVNTLGHAHPALVGAVTQQLQTLGHVSNFFATEPQVALAEKLLSLLGVPPGGGKVFFANSGTEANEAALKLTRRTGRTHLVAMEGSFHGRTMGSLALTSKAAYREPFEPLPGDVTFVPYGDPDALAAAVTDRTAAVVIEPVQGEAGVVPAPDGFLAHARETTTRHGALLWLDEIQCGMGRTGSWLASEDSGVVPDLITLAKGLGGGIPVGALVAVGESGTLLGPGNHGTTFGGNPVAAAAALAVIATIEADGLLDNAAKVGELLREGLAADPRVTEVRGRGLLVGLDLDADVAPQVADAAMRHGVILNACTPHRIRLAPPLVLHADQASEFLALWPRILDDAYEGAPPGQPGTRSGGRS